ncbi:MAG: hypothetical protein WA581_18270 [Candidatus Acidiferrales bacterium]
MSRAEDKTFGLWTQGLNFDPRQMASAPDRERIRQLIAEITEERPQEVEAIRRAAPIYRHGHIVTPSPVAFELKTPRSLDRAFDVISVKLTHALYFRETGKYLSSAHRFMAAIYQPQVAGTEHFTSFLTSLLEKISIGGRTNIKEYGERFGYRSSYKEDGDFFVYGSQFGCGLIVWGVVCGPNMQPPTIGPLATEAVWRNGAWGAIQTPPRTPIQTPDANDPLIGAPSL